jgi:hypothetical protein
MSGRALRIGNGCGFWGDNLDAPIQLVERGELDVLTLEYLAELTMSILARQKQRDPQSGYAGDFLDVLERLTPFLKQQPQLAIVTNAGGMNPTACATHARTILDKAGLTERRIGTVEGDDLLPRLDELLGAGHLLNHLDTGEALTAVRQRVVGANAYLGSAGIVAALRQGASVVITGRVADASLTLAPAMHAFGWAEDDWDRLAAGIVAGHLIECGAQVTGGLWCNVTPAHDLGHVGYPIAVVEADGTCTITKPPGTGGAVNIETVSEQLLYEVGDPAAYLTPDVVADFTSVQLAEIGRDQVRITGARGKPATPTFKVSIGYRDGWTASGTLVLAGPDAAAKARWAGTILLERLATAGAVPEKHLVEVLGGGDLVPGVLTPPGPLPEALLRVAVRDPSKVVVERFSKEFAPLVTAGPPGVTGYTTGRPVVREVFAYWPALVSKVVVPPRVTIL